MFILFWGALYFRVDAGFQVCILVSYCLISGMLVSARGSREGQMLGMSEGWPSFGEKSTCLIRIL